MAALAERALFGAVLGLCGASQEPVEPTYAVMGIIACGIGGLGVRLVAKRLALGSLALTCAGFALVAIDEMSFPGPIGPLAPSLVTGTPAMSVGGVISCLWASRG